MAVIRNADDLLRAFPNGFDATDFSGEVSRGRHTLAPELEREFATSLKKYRDRAGAAKLKRWSELRAGGKMRVVKAQPPFVLKRKAPGDWDIIASVKLASVDEILRSLLASRTIPAAINLRDHLTADQLQSLIGLLRGSFTGVPAGNSISVGKLHLREVLASQPIPDTNQVRLSVRFALDVVGPSTSPVGGGQPVLVQFLGVLHVLVVARADISFTGEPSMVIRIAFPDSITADMVQITVAPDSPIQANSAEALSRFGITVALLLKLAFGDGLKNFSMSPVIHLPKFSETTILVRDIQLRARTEDGGTLVVGALVGGGPTNGDTARLTSPFGGTNANMFLRLHEDLLKEAIKRAKESGELEKMARKEDDDLRIDSANAEIHDGKIRFLLTGRVVNACAWTIDARWDAHIDITFRPEGNKVIVEWSGDASPDWSHPKTYLCILVMLVAGVIGAVTLGLLTTPTIVAVVGLILGIQSLSTIKTIVLGVDFAGDSVISLNIAIPGTELLPRLAPISLTAKDGAQVSFYNLTFIPDQFNTHVYALVNAKSGPPFNTVRPLSGLKVRLVDQDVPRPAGDDSVIPPLGEQVTVQTPKVMTTVTTSFQPPAQDDVLGEVTTTSEGIAHFTIAPNRFRNAAGKITTTRVTERFDTGQTQVHTSSRFLTESRPDLYFVVLLGAGATVDSRNQMPLMLNQLSGRVGSPGQPVELVVKDGPIISR